MSEKNIKDISVKITQWKCEWQNHFKFMKTVCLSRNGEKKWTRNKMSPTHSAPWSACSEIVLFSLNPRSPAYRSGSRCGLPKQIKNLSPLLLLWKGKKNTHHTAEGCRELEGKTHRKKKRKSLERGETTERGGDGKEKRWRYKEAQRRVRETKGGDRTLGQTERERCFKIAGGWKLIFRAH